MKINFIVPFTGKTGGVKVVYEYANRLQDKGHDVVIYVPMKAYSITTQKGIKNIIAVIKGSIGNTFKRGNKVEWFNLKAKVKLVPLINDSFIRDADATIATAWPTAYSVDKLSESKGKKYYFIQHYEVWSGDEERVDGSYKLPLNRIVIAKWLKELMENKFNEKICALIPNGLDFSEFYNTNKGFNKEKVILILYHELEWKGFDDSIKCVEKIRETHPEVKVKVFGMKRGKNIPDYAEFYENPPKEKLRELYSTSDIYMASSWAEGWHLPPMEAMACKCAVAATNVGCIPDIGIHRETAMVCEPKDVNTMTKNVLELIENEELLKEISMQGYELIKNFTWEKAADDFEKVLKNSK